MKRESNFLKCDRVGCDHVEEHERITKDMIGKPCPQCGDSLLTESDYRFWLFMSPVLTVLMAIDWVAGMIIDYWRAIHGLPPMPRVHAKIHKVDGEYKVENES
jgi:ssDNA-binding Zn-finger/Zn-ribbon topoisomerase 1